MTTKDTDKFLIPGLQITEVLTSEVEIFKKIGIIFNA